jgi:hypothetical protein
VTAVGLGLRFGTPVRYRSVTTPEHLVYTVIGALAMIGSVCIELEAWDSRVQVRALDVESGELLPQCNRCHLFGQRSADAVAQTVAEGTVARQVLAPHVERIGGSPSTS